MRRLPKGTVSLLFTDIEGSTRLLAELGSERYVTALERHRRLLRDAVSAHDGVEVEMQGDSFLFAFASARNAVLAAAAGQRALEAVAGETRIAVRMGIHTGEPIESDGLYAGIDVHRAARVMAAGHGGQVVVTEQTASLTSGELDLSGLGEHRLKDFDDPVALYQLGDGSFPPLKTVSNTNLPRPASSFIGRERELSDVLSRVEHGARLVTLTGPGGSGKTRLALEAAATLVPAFEAGVFWVGLAALRDPALVTESIAQTLGAKDGLPEHIGERELLLLLDNLEQVIETAPDLSRLLRACPNLTLLVTSRELLRVQGEVEYAVPPLAEREAVELFCARAQLQPSDEIADLCARLDNLPLAVELAAARAKALSPAQILARLFERLDLLKGGRDIDPRQQTLRATIEWSHDLLTEDERELFRRLAVFAGGCTIEAAERICAADLDTLQSLVEKSLLRFTDERYWMLETIREFARERLEEAGESEQIAWRHAVWFVELCDQAKPELLANRDLRWLDRLELERANLRTAVETLVAVGDSELPLRLTGGIWTFWFRRGHLAEGRRLAEAALAVGTAADPALRVDALWGATKFALFQGDLAASGAHARELLSLSERHGLSRGVAIAYEILAMVAMDEGELERARELFERSAELARGGGDDFLMGSIANNFGVMLMDEGDLSAAAACFEEALAIGEATGDRYRVLTAQANLGFATFAMGDADGARALFDASLAAASELGDAQWAGCGLLGLALTEVDHHEAVAMIGTADAVLEDLAVQYSEGERALRDAALASARACLGEAAFGFAYDEGKARSLKAAVSVARGSAS